MAVRGAEAKHPGELRLAVPPGAVNPGGGASASINIQPVGLQLMKDRGLSVCWAQAVFREPGTPPHTGVGVLCCRRWLLGPQSVALPLKPPK